MDLDLKTVGSHWREVIRAAMWSESARGLLGSLHCNVEGCGRVRRTGSM